MAHDRVLVVTDLQSIDHQLPIAVTIGNVAFQISKGNGTYKAELIHPDIQVAQYATLPLLAMFQLLNYLVMAAADGSVPVLKLGIAPEARPPAGEGEFGDLTPEEWQEIFGELPDENLGV
jgi:hypothetical protein